MKATTKKDLKLTAAGLPILVAMFIASGEPSPECSATTFWIVEGICIVVIVACSFIIRKIYTSTK